MIALGIPNINRNGYEEYLKNHIENAIFFDLDNNSNQKRPASYADRYNKLGKNNFKHGNKQ